MKTIDFGSLIIEDIDTSDYPDFCDAFVASGLYTDGTPLTDEDLDKLNDDTCLLHELVWATLY